MTTKDNPAKSADASRESTALSGAREDASRKGANEALDAMMAQYRAKIEQPRENTDSRGEKTEPLKMTDQAGKGDQSNFSHKGGTYHIERDSAGRVKRVVEDMGGVEKAYDIERDQHGKLKRVVETTSDVNEKTGQIEHKSRVLDHTKEFDDAKIGKDGVLTLSKDGKISEARTLDGGHREFTYDQSGKLTKIVDTVHTNNNKDITETYNRIGNSNAWTVENNFGAKRRIATNVVTNDNGQFKADRVNELVRKDFTDDLHKNVAAAREHFTEVASKYGMSSFVKTWGKKFEDRVHDQAHRGQKSPTDAQITETYNTLGKILQTHKHISENSAKLLVRSALRSYAIPQDYINQSDHPSCAFAMTERHVVGRSPQEHARVLYEAVNNMSVRSKGGSARVRLNKEQILPEEQNVTEEKGGFGWSYSNKIFQLTAIEVGYGNNYGGRGYGFGGGTEDQTDRACRFVDGEKGMPMKFGNDLGSPQEIKRLLGKYGTIGLFNFIPGHAMAITDIKQNSNGTYVYIDNWWGKKKSIGQQGAGSEGWHRLA